MRVFSWCLTNQHDLCKREYQRWVMVPNRKRGEPPNKIEWLDEWVHCECRKRSCPCYVKPADRVKKKKPRRRKK